MATETTFIQFAEGSAPSTPASTKWRAYFKTDGLYVIDDAGTETGPLAAAVAAATFVGVSLTKSATQSISSGVTTAITFDGEDFDTDGFHSTVSNTSRITIPTGKGGKYQVTGLPHLDSLVAGNNVTVAILKNGVAIGPRISYQAGATLPVGLPLVVLLDLVATDYIEVAVNHNNGAAKNARPTSSGTTFQAYKVG